MQITGPAQPPGFSPALLIVHVNDTVVFVNQSSPPTPFGVTSNDGSFSSPTIAPGNQWTATFNAIGTHQYHETANPQLMVGEVLVVTNTVALLPTPIPEAEATVLAAIEAGHTPPDTIILPMPTPMSTAVKSGNVSASASPLPWILTIVAVLALIGFGIWFFRRMRRRAREREEAEDNLLQEATPARPAPRQTEPPPQSVVEPPAPAKKARKLVIAGFLRRRKQEEDDDMDMEIEDYGDE